MSARQLQKPKMLIAAAAYAVDQVSRRRSLRPGQIGALVLYGDGSGRVVLESMAEPEEVLYTFDSLFGLGVWVILQDSSRIEFEARARGLADD